MPTKTNKQLQPNIINQKLEMCHKKRKSLELRKAINEITKNVHVHTNSNNKPVLIRAEVYKDIGKKQGGEKEMERITQTTDGKKVADAMRALQAGFMKARGISKDDIRIRDILEVRTNEK